MENNLILLNEDNKTLLEKVLESLSVSDRSYFDALTDSEARVVLYMLDEIRRTGNEDIVKTIWEIDFDEKPVSIQTFLSDPNYLGKLTIYDIWKEELSVICAPDSCIMEVLINGSIGCFTSDTKISLLNGTEVPISDLVKDQEYWVYGCKPSGEVIPTKVKALGITRQDNKYAEVTLDNDEVVKCTTDHLFMLRDGTYKRADELIENESLMPLYRKDSNTGYELYYDNLDRVYYSTYMVIGELNLCSNTREDARIKLELKDNPENRFVIYHRDFNKRNNDPSNLLWMGWYEHLRYHQKLGSDNLVRYNNERWKDPEYAKEVSDRITKLNDDPEFKASASHRLSELHKDPEFAKAQSERSSFIMISLNNNPEFAKKRSDVASVSMSKLNSTGNNIRGRILNQIILSKSETYVEFLGRATQKFDLLTIEEYFGCWEIALECSKDKHYYCVLFNHKVKSVRITYSDTLIDFYDLYSPETNNFALTAGVFVHNSGKTFISTVAQLYKIYRLLCLKDPQKYYGLEGFTSIALGLFNITLERAYKVNYTLFEGMMMSSPWFSKYVKTKRDTAWVEFPKGIVLSLGSGVTHALGENVFGGNMDENDFTRSADYRTVEEVYLAIRRRMVSRFGQYVRSAGTPSLLCLTSSTTHDANSFMNKRINAQETEPDKYTRICGYALWDAKPLEVYKGTKFKVFIGDDFRNASILPDNYDDKEYSSAAIIDVPEFFRKDFRDDLETSIMDIAGVRLRSGGKNKFFRNKAALLKCCENRLASHPFTMSDLYITIHNGLVIKDFFKQDIIFAQYNDLDRRFAPIVNRNSPRYIHVDLAKNSDCVGLSCVHNNGFNLQEVITDQKRMVIKKPKIYVDFMIRISSLPGSEIDFSRIIDFIMYLVALGMKVRSVSYDSYQSVHSLQEFEKSRLIPIVETLSVDRTDKAYTDLKSIILDDRFSLYNYSPFINEFCDLERDIDNRKVDHPPNGGCFTADTKISLLNGTEIPISDLVKDHVYWVYGCKENGEITFIRAKSLGITRIVNQLVEVTLDNDEIIKCTIDHLFMLRDGTYKRADELSEGESLMPLYRELDHRGYEYYIDNINSREWYTHQIVAATLFCLNDVETAWINIKCILQDETEKSLVIHHTDFNKRNNESSNLFWMSRNEHRDYHLKIRWNNPVLVKEASDRFIALNKNPEFAKKKSERSRKNMIDLHSNPEFNAINANILTNANLNGDVTRGKIMSQIIKSKSCTYDEFVIRAKFKYKLSVINYYFGCWDVALESSRNKNYYNILFNHKIKSISLIDVIDEPVYDLYSPETSNFALTAGVFVHNSKDVSDSVAGATTMCIRDFKSDSQSVSVITSRSDLSNKQNTGIPEDFHIEQKNRIINL